ncbi:MAG: signal peptidase I [Candidatus Babeliales bacterium]
MALHKYLFKKWLTKYRAKKDHFVAVIEKQKEKGRSKDSTHCSHLLAALEEDLQTISRIEQEKGTWWTYTRATRRFKRNFKELDELTKPIWRQWTESLVFAIIVVLILKNFVFGQYLVPTGSAEPTILVGDHILGNKMAYYFSDVKRGEYIIVDDPMFTYDKSNIIKYAWQKYVGFFAVPFLGLSAGPISWTKRVIGLPGDTIEGKVENGKPVIYLNGKKLDEPYINPYPLIHVSKTVGFFDRDSFIGSFMPSFLLKGHSEHASHGEVKYTYDPARTLDDQPFYKNFTNEEIVHSSISGEAIMTYPFTPYHHDVFGPFTLAPGKYWVMGDNRQNSYDCRFWLFLDRSTIQGRAVCNLWSLDTQEAFWAFELIKHPITFWTKAVRWNRFFKVIKHEPGTPVEIK